MFKHLIKYSFMQFWIPICRKQPMCLWYLLVLSLLHLNVNNIAKLKHQPYVAPNSAAIDHDTTVKLTTHTHTYISKRE